MRHSLSIGLTLTALLLSASASAAVITSDHAAEAFPADRPASSIELSSAGRDPHATAGHVTVPLPSAVWLFASGLIGLISVTRRTA